MNKTIEIIVLPDGKTHVETKGFLGRNCKQASQFLEQALGKQANEQLTPEYYASNSQEQHLQEGQ